MKNKKTIGFIKKTLIFLIWVVSLSFVHCLFFFIFATGSLYLFSLFSIKNISSELMVDLIFAGFSLYLFPTLAISPILQTLYDQIVFAVSPTCEKLEDKKTLDVLTKAFVEANLKVPFFYVWEKSNMFQPYILGTTWGRGMFWYSVFLPSVIFEQMNIDEVKALVLRASAVQHLKQPLRRIWGHFKVYFVCLLSMLSASVFLELVFQVTLPIDFLPIYFISFAILFFFRGQKKVSMKLKQMLLPLKVGPIQEH